MNCRGAAPFAAIAGLIATAVVVAIALSGCSASAPSAPSAAALAPASSAPVELDVSAASSLKSVLATTAAAFEKANNAKVVFNYGASGVLQKQIEAGSPTDVFLSASPKQVTALTAEALVSQGATETFAGNDLVILVPAGNPAGIHGPSDLARAKRLATGDPATAPHGAKAQEWLTGLGMWDALLPKFVFGQNAAQTDDYVARGEVDAGIGFASDAKGRSDIQVAYVVPKPQYKPIKYVAAVIATSRQHQLAKAYLTYLLSPEFQTALTDAGFNPAPAK